VGLIIWIGFCFLKRIIWIGFNLQVPGSIHFFWAKKKRKEKKRERESCCWVIVKMAEPKE
jgi:hypothetical protein